MEDMEKILKYKSAFRFFAGRNRASLSWKKPTKFRDETVLGIFRVFWKTKQAELEKKKKKYDTIGGAESRDHAFSDQLYELGPQRQRHSLYIPALSGMPGLRQTPQTGISQHQRQ